MFKYFATKGNVIDVVVKLEKNLLDFADYGSCVTEPKHQWNVYGWVKTITELPEDVKNSFGLLDD